MKIFFYLWGIMNLIFFTLPFILTPIKRGKLIFNIMGWWKSLPFKEGSTTEKDFDLDEIPKEIKTSTVTILLGTLSFLAWLIIGLFSFNWFIFLAFLVYVFAIGKLGSYFVNNHMTTEYYVYVFIHNLIEALMIIFVAINSYHLKIDVWQYVQSLF